MIEFIKEFIVAGYGTADTTPRQNWEQHKWDGVQDIVRQLCWTVVWVAVFLAFFHLLGVFA